MSDKYVARALRSDADFSTQERLALMLLADGANDDGQVRAVSEDNIAEIMRSTRADVHKILRGLYENGFLKTYSSGIQILLEES